MEISVEQIVGCVFIVLIIDEYVQYLGYKVKISKPEKVFIRKITVGKDDVLEIEPKIENICDWKETKPGSKMFTPGCNKTLIHFNDDGKACCPYCNGLINIVPSEKEI